MVDGNWIKGKTKSNRAEVEKWEEDNKEWIKKNRKALRWIVNSVDGKVISLVQHCTTAKEALENLRDRCATRRPT